MDPQIALREALEALTHGDNAAAANAFEALASWLDRDGYAPMVMQVVGGNGPVDPDSFIVPNADPRCVVKRIA